MSNLTDVVTTDPDSKMVGYLGVNENDPEMAACTAWEEKGTPKKAGQQRPNRKDRKNRKRRHAGPVGVEQEKEEAWQSHPQLKAAYQGVDTTFMRGPSPTPDHSRRRSPQIRSRPPNSSAQQDNIRHRSATDFIFSRIDAKKYTIISVQFL